MQHGLRHYLVVTAGYWTFTITDGAIRMLILLYFHGLGYTPFEVATLFLFYELFGIVTNLLGGWLGSRIGLNLIMHIGMFLQVIALSMLTVPDPWLSVVYVMFAQALSGIAKDLNKMAAKASIKLFVPDEPAQNESSAVSASGHSRLFQWIAVLTGSKNALKGAGFFIGALLLQVAGFRGALWTLAGMLLAMLAFTMFMLPRELGKASKKPKFTHLFSQQPRINRLSVARFFLFGSRDIWFVVALPVFLHTVLGWSFSQTGGFLALWVIGYGIVQASVPGLLKKYCSQKPVDGHSARFWAFALVFVPLIIGLLIYAVKSPVIILIVGLSLYAIVFAINSAVHSYLIVAWSDADKVSMNVGFYYMANAAGRLVGTLLSGLLYQFGGLVSCLLFSSLFVFSAFIFSFKLEQ